MSTQPGHPEHVEATVVTTTTWHCRRCQARVTPGQYEREGYGEQVLAEWLTRHQHDDPQAPP